MKAITLLRIFCKLNGYSMEFDRMTTIFGSKRDLIVLHKRSK